MTCMNGYPHPTGCLVLPGSIDVHTHIQEPFMGTTTSDDWYQGTSAAAAGGVTTVVDFAYQPHGGRLRDAVRAWHDKADGQAIIDYGFHVAIFDFTPRAADEIGALVEDGYTSFKMFMCYDGLALDDLTILEALDRIRDAGALAMFHTENDAIVRHLIRRAVTAGESHPRWVARTRPQIAEVEATYRALALAEVAKAAAYVVHMSSPDAAEHVRQARDAGRPVAAETCPHYLTLDVDLLEQDGWEAAKYTCAPPLRDATTRARLWAQLRDGVFSVVGSDHDCFNFHGQKDLGRDAFERIPLGIPGIETRLPLLFSEGVAKQRISAQRLVAATATEPARLFGLYPQKGAIAVGADADLVVYDPERRVTLSQRLLHQHVDYTPYEGWELTGYPRTTISRGEVVFDDGVVLAEPGRGRFIARQRSCLVTDPQGGGQGSPAWAARR
jgi:dihydropyrimidinase